MHFSLGVAGGCSPHPEPGLLPASLITSPPSLSRAILWGSPPPGLCALGRAAQLFPGWWFGPGQAVPTTLTPAQCPPRFGQALASIRNYLPPAPQFKGLGRLPTQVLLALPGPPPPVPEYPPVLSWAGRVDCPLKPS